MSYKLFFRNVGLGVLSWVIPFVVSFFCYTPDGELMMEYSTFKSIITVVGTASGSYLLYLFFKPVRMNFIFCGCVVGISWFVLNILLDSLILIPMMGVSFATYFMSVGLSYLSIPPLAIAMGFLLDRNTRNNRI